MSSYVAQRARLPPRLDSTLELRDHIGGILGAKDGGAGNNDVGACLCCLINGSFTESTIDFDIEIWISISERPDLRQLGSHELLTAEARVYGHDKNHLSADLASKRGRVGRIPYVRHLLFVRIVENFPQNVHRCLGLNGNAG